MASKVKINNGKIMDGGKQVGMIKNGSIYDRNSTSSTYLLAMTKICYQRMLFF